MKLESLNGTTIDYLHQSGTGPCLIFCGGFNSNKKGTKAVTLADYCLTHGYEYIRFDYQGHGESSGDFGECTISTWLNDTLSIIDSVAATQTVVLVGSSMGGWLALLAAQRRPHKVVGLLLIACAIDMTNFYPERLDGSRLKLDKSGRAYYSLANEYDDQQPYRIYQAMINDGDQYRLLDSEAQLAIPIQLIHGQQDDVIPWQRSLSVLNEIATGDATLTLIKSGDHRLSSTRELHCIELALSSLLVDVAKQHSVL